MKKGLKIIAVILLLMASSRSNSAALEIEAAGTVPQRQDMKLPSAPGTQVKGTSLVQMDYSNIDQGYFQVKTLNANHKRLKVQVFKGADDKSPYKYDINKNFTYETIPLTKGNGDYIVKVYENTEGNKYAVLMTVNFTVNMADDKLPYLYPNQIVDYTATSNTVNKAFELAGNQASELARIKSVYTYVIGNVKYDWDKVQAVQGIYVLPVVDTTLATNKGICFDYAALTAAMLRVQGIPTKVVTGYVDEGYHAWVEVYSSELGWISPSRYFYSWAWNSTDPTFDASNKNYKGSYQIKYNY